MLDRSIFNRLRLWLGVAMLLAFGAAMAAEPTLKQVYDAAQSGRLDEAQTMMQQVLVAHPNSAKAHFVHAELLLRRGHPAEARDALRTAEKLAPGLPFAKPEAVEALRSRLAKPPAARSEVTGSGRNAAPAAAPPAPAAGIPWTLIAIGGAAAIALAMFLRRRKQAQQAPGVGSGPLAASGYANQPPAAGNWGGPQNFGQPGGPYGQQPGYGQPGGSGVGGRVMGGLATGLAVGAGVMAAQAIGKTLTGNDEAAAAAPEAGHGLAPGASDYDLGGQNFGVADSGSWDDGSALGGVADGGGDWEN